MVFLFVFIYFDKISEQSKKRKFNEINIPEKTEITLLYLNISNLRRIL